MDKHYTFGDYVITGITNAFNNKVSWWISKKNCTLACYCFSTGHIYQAGPPSPTKPDDLLLSKIKEVFGSGNNYNIVRWDTHYEREQGLSTLAHADKSLEEAMSLFTDECTNYPCVEVQVDDTALCIGGTEADVAIPEWLCLDLIGIPSSDTASDKELSLQLSSINGYIAMFESRLASLT